MAKTPPEKRHKLQDATKPLDDFDRLARKRLGLPPREKLVNPSRRRWLPPFLLLLIVACLVGYGFRHFRGRAAIPPVRKPLVLSFLNVGQGDSTLIQTPSGKNILIDTGPPGYRPALFNELEQRNVDRLDFFIITHYDDDHSGNAIAVLNRFPITTVVESGFDGFNRFNLTKYDLKNESERRKIPIVLVAQKLVDTNQELGGGVTLTYLAPNHFLRKPNNNSVILKVSMGKVSFLLMGDAEEEERHWLLSSGQDVQATVLKVAHHGASNGTDDLFLVRVNPKIAVISCGRNSHGHPDNAVLAALERGGVKTLRTDEEGTIDIETNGTTLIVTPHPK